MDDSTTERSYEVLACLGRGAFAEVYHARMRGPQGFVRDVALKVARSGVEFRTLARFRDEARILGLLRDPAVVAAAPPLLVDGRWVMVMDYVDGATVRQCLDHQTFSGRAALELVGEVARVLDKAQHQAGPDGTPLALVHRDVKPRNLMVTAEGHVKVLDFGIARAEFPHREAMTIGTFVGTPGYIAPERLKGLDGPHGDIYSLGVLLHVLVTGQSASEVDVEDLAWTEGSELDPILQYARGMRSPDPYARPTAADVAQQCRAWLPHAPGLDLRAFAAEVVPMARKRFKGPLVGMIIGEGGILGTQVQPAAELQRPTVPAPPRSPWRAGLAVVAGVVAFATIVTWPSPEVPPVDRAPVVPASVPEPVGPAAPPPVMVKSAPPEPPPEVRPPANVRPARVVPVPPRLTTVSFFSEPPGAEVLIDEVLVGHTPLRDHPVSVGNRALRFRRGNQGIQRTVRVGGRHGARAFTWTSGGVVAE